MEFTKEDFDGTKKLAAVISKIDNIDIAYMDAISDDIYKKQPFLLSMLLGYKDDVSPLELEELMKIYFLIWEYFKDRGDVGARKITAQLFDKYHNKNIHMLRYVETENADQRDMVYEQEMNSLKSKALLSAILLRLNTRDVFIKMDERTRGIIMIGFKSLIDCFETILMDKKG